ncbi:MULTISPECIES: putative holin-like toxin [unclassified Oceanobacillus]|uniref:putative holin-like toxin n=1 Tax=unclassified Oceanobacillus TaxID=2630292 RepID=UPI003FA55200
MCNFCTEATFQALTFMISFSTMIIALIAVVASIFLCILDSVAPCYENAYPLR